MSALAVLRVGRFSWFLVVFLLDTVCEMLWMLTLGWVAAQAGSGAQTGLILFSGAIPSLLLALFGGALADRFGSGQVAIYTLAARCLILLAWAGVATADIAPLVLVAVAAAAVGTVAGLHDPAMYSYTTALLPPQGRQAATTIERFVIRAAQGAGGAAGGVLLAHAGAGGTSLVAAALAFAALLMLLRIRPHRESVTATSSVEPLRHQMADGLRLVRQHPVLRWTVPCQAAVSVVGASALMAVLPLKARENGWSASLYGLAFGLSGLGMVLGTMAAFLIQRYADRVQVIAGVCLMITECLAVAALGGVGSARAAVLLAGLMGLAGGPIGPLLTGYARSSVPHTVAGRVGSVIVMGGMMEPFGWLVTGMLASLISVDAAAEIVGGAGAMIGLFALVRLLATRPAFAVTPQL